MKKLLTLILFASLLSACSSYDYPTSVKVGEPLISFEGESLAGEAFSFPSDAAGEKTLFLFGYVHDAQFDIDRWLIGLDMSKTQVKIYEIPAIKNFFVGLFSDAIDDGMREGIPNEIWSDVVTVYKDGKRVQKYTGNVKPKNARVILVDEKGIVLHFYDRGFSVAALNALREKI